MKRFTRIVYLSFCLNFLFIFVSPAQGDLDFAQEEVIMPVYDYEFIPDFTYEEVEKRVNNISSEMGFELNETIFAFINYFTVRNRDYTRMVLARKDIYLPLFEEALSRHAMPDDIKYLAIIESGLNPRARSRVGAMGLWQFMPATGREYRLFVTNHIDERMDPELSTEAAFKYLRVLHNMFGDWELALAAYNCGPGNVRKAIRRSGGKKSFWEIYNYLPRETRSYIPQFQAMMYVFRYAEAHNFVLEEPTFPIAYEKVQFSNGLHLEHLAELTGVCLEDLEELNPSLLHRQLPDNQINTALRIPVAKAQFLADNQDWIMDSLHVKAARFVANQYERPKEPMQQASERITYRIRSGDALGTIAQRYRTSVSDLKKWNGLSSNLIKPGQTLVIYPAKGYFDRNVASASSGQSTPDNQNGKIYTVQPGDSLWLISRKIDGVTIEQIKKLNNLNNNNIKPGQKLIIG